MLLVDPLKRITIPEIRQHPWFTLHLPRYLAVMQVRHGSKGGGEEWGWGKAAFMQVGHRRQGREVEVQGLKRA